MPRLIRLARSRLSRLLPRLLDPWSALVERAYLQPSPATTATAIGETADGPIRHDPQKMGIILPSPRRHSRFVKFSNLRLTTPSSVHILHSDGQEMYIGRF